MVEVSKDGLLLMADAAVAFALDLGCGYPTPEMDAGIRYAQERGFDRWSMQSQMNGTVPAPKGGYSEAFEQAHALIQEAKGAGGPNGGFITDHLDFAEHWLWRAEEHAATLQAERDRYRVGLVDGSGDCLIALNVLREAPEQNADAIRVFALIHARLANALSDAPVQS